MAQRWAMSFALSAVILATMVGTSFLSGIFGMAGGLVLIGLLLFLLPVPEAMALHAVTQIASNGWRATLSFAHIRWRVVATFSIGPVLALGFWSLVLFVPPKPVALILLGISPFLLKLLPRGVKPDPERPLHAILGGMASMSLMVLTGVAGPLLDAFFLSGRFDRRVVIATKAACQVLQHSLKLIYFGVLVPAAGVLDPAMAAAAVLASMLGTWLARPVLERMSEAGFRRWSGIIVTAIAVFYVAQGTALLIWP